MAKYLRYITDFLIGAAILCSCSVLQKTIIGAPIVWKGFIVPFLFGGFAGAAICIRSERIREFANELKKNNEHLEIKIQERTAELKRDIEKREQAEKALRKNELLFRGVFESSPAGIAVVDTRNQQILEANPSFCRLIGYSAEEMTGLSVKDITHPEDWRKETELIRNDANNPSVAYDIEKRFIHKNGKIVWVRLTGAVFTLEDREYPLAFATALDITEWKRSEVALKKSENEKRIILNNLKDTAIEYVDPDMRLIWCSDSVLQNIHPSCEQVAGEHCYKIVFGKNEPCDDCSAVRAFETGRIQEMEKQTEDGRSWLVQSIPIEHEPGNIEAVVHFGFDITRLKGAEEDRKRTDERFRAFVENANDIVFSLTPDGIFTYVSPNWTNILGHDPSEVTGTHFSDYVHPDDIGICQDYMENVLTSEKSRNFAQYRVYHKNGRMLWHTTNGSLITDRDTGLPVFMGIARDITELKRSEEQLRISETKYRTLFESSRDALLLMSPETMEFHSANETAVKMFGFRREADLVSKSPADLSPDRQEDGSLSTEAAVRRVKQCLDKGSVFFEWNHKRKDGEVFPATVLLTRFVLLGQTMLQATVRDITEQKRAEAEKLLLERRLLEMKRLESLGVLAGGIAHDFNNILMAVLGNIDLAKEGVPREGMEFQFLDEAEKATHRAAALVRQMLAYSGKGQFIVEPLDINAVIRDTTEVLKNSIPQNISLRIRPGLDLPPIEGDADRLKQIVMNLATNAAESYDKKPGTVTIETGVLFCREKCLRETVSEVWIGYEDPFKEGDYVYLEVSDDGCGMEEETRKRIFDPFFTTKFTGRGLGLPAVLGIARGHNAFIRAESKPGEGTVFQVLFPILEHVPATSAETARTPPANENDKKHGCILVVDDEEQVRIVVQAMLERRGYNVICAANGLEALKKYREYSEQIDVVLLDLSMPGMSGIEVFRELQTINPNVGAILTSGYSEEDLKENTTGKGFAGFIQKPYQKKRLIDTIQRLIQ